MVSFNTTSGMPLPFATFGNAAARAATPITDVKTNVAEAGTLSMEFTTIGRLLGKRASCHIFIAHCTIYCTLYVHVEATAGALHAGQATSMA